MRAGWNERELQTLPTYIDEFQNDACRVFENYQPSVMENMKVRLLEHLTKDLLSFRSIEYLHSGLNEAIHERFRKAQGRTSK